MAWIVTGCSSLYGLLSSERLQWMREKVIEFCLCPVPCMYDLCVGIWDSAMMVSALLPNLVEIFSIVPSSGQLPNLPLNNVLFLICAM